LSEGLGCTAQPARDLFFVEAARLTSPDDDSPPIREKCVRERLDPEYLLERPVASCPNRVGEADSRQKALCNGAFLFGKPND
jgi:hypothetical protein